MKSYILRRILLSIPTLLGVTIAIFLLLHLIPEPCPDDRWSGSQRRDGGADPQEFRIERSACHSIFPVYEECFPGRSGISYSMQTPSQGDPESSSRDHEVGLHGHDSRHPCRCDPWGSVRCQAIFFSRLYHYGICSLRGFRARFLVRSDVDAIIFRKTWISPHGRGWEPCSPCFAGSHIGSRSDGHFGSDDSVEHAGGPSQDYIRTAGPRTGESE